MMKKIICLVLGLLMVASVLTSCSGNDGDIIDNINDKASRLTTTLNMWVITENPVIAQVSDLANAGLDPEKDESKLSDTEKAQLAALSEEQRTALSQLVRINQAINKITKVKFKTKLNIKYFTEAEYYGKLEEALAKSAQGGSANKAETTGKDETVINEYGIPELKYPTAPDHQVDILFLSGYGRYQKYIQNEWIKSLETQLNDEAILISKYVNDAFLKGVAYSGERFAVPNNTTIGEYTYVCVKREEVEKFGYTVEALKNSSIYDENYYNLFTALNESNNYGKFLYAPDGIDSETLHYWNFDLDSADGECVLNPDVFSIFGDAFDNINGTTSALTKQGDKLVFSNLISDPVFMKNYLARKAEYNQSYVTTENANGNSAVVCVVKGGWELRQQYEANGYEVLITENPRATNDSVYASMFALGEKTADESRAMEILTYLNTNAEFRNLLQYGVEDENYTLSTVTMTDENGVETDLHYVVETEKNVYKMDVRKTGNMFLAYPDSADAVLEWEYGKQQNLEASTYPTLALKLNLSNYKLDKKSIRIINAVSARFGVYMNTLTTPEAIIACYEEAPAATNYAAMASFLLSKTNNDMTYTEGTEVKTFTQAELEAALACMATTKVVDDDEALQSPNALYNDWLENSGVRG